MGALVEIYEVAVNPPRADDVWGWFIDRPKSGNRIEAQALDVVGWVLGRSAPAVAVEFVHEGRTFRRVPINVERPDLTVAFPHVAEAERGGFRATLSVLGTVPELELQVQAVLRDQRRVSLGVIRARRCWRNSGSPVDETLVSVVIPCYNQGHFLREAIESVLAQTYPHFELVVVDDGSTDNTAEVAASYPGVRCVRQENLGLGAARNAGLRCTNGDYLVFLDADDRLLPHALETGLDCLRAHPECAFVSGHYVNVSFDGYPIATPMQRCAQKEHYEALLRYNYIGMHATVMYRRAVFEHVKGFDSSLRACEDYDLYFRIARCFPVYCHHQIVTEYRCHGRNMSRNNALMLKTAVSVLRRQRKYVNKNSNHRAAYRVGKKCWREYYGGALVRELACEWREAQWTRALRGTLTLLLYHPRGVLPLLRETLFVNRRTRRMPKPEMAERQ